MSRIIKISEAPTAVGEYFQAVRAGVTLNCAGQIRLDPRTSELVSSDVAVENVRVVLVAERMTFANVVRAAVFHAEMNDYRVMNNTYASFFGERPPVPTTIATSGLPRSARIESDAIAVVE